MNGKTWYFGPTADLEMFGEDDEYSGWVWIADNPDGWLDDSHITDYIESILPPGFCEQCESVFNHTSNSYEEVRKLLVEAGFVEARQDRGHNDDDEDDEDMSNTCVNVAPETEVKLANASEYVNAPKDLGTAIERIMQLEFVLSDLARASEIASITGQHHLTESFRDVANEMLKTKVEIKEQDHGPFKLTIVTNDKEADA